VGPERIRISCHAALDSMKCSDATKVNRKSG
jgi:hypothetical protein